MKVHIRKRKNSKGDKINLALEVYNGYTKNKEGKIKANRITTRLEYYLYSDPKTPSQKTHNKEVEIKVDIIRAEKEKDFLNGKYGFKSEGKGKVNFIEYFRRLTIERISSKGNYGNWDSVLKHLIKYSGESISIDSIDLNFCEGFKKYLLETAKTSSEKNLALNSATSYFCKLRTALNNAVDDGYILNNPSLKISIPKEVEVKREYLTVDEVKLLFKTNCRYDVLKRAFLFSCLTGLRWSDINLLDWSELKKEGENWKIVFHQQKTKGLQYHYINEQAKSLLGNQNEKAGRIFSGLRYSAYMNVALLQWVIKAGIHKNITFHCARHTFATMQLTLGTDLFTVSKLLGHSEIRTTQVYAKVIDQKKIDAANVIPTFNID
jgi:integrase